MYCTEDHAGLGAARARSWVVGGGGAPDLNLMRLRLGLPAADAPPSSGPLIQPPAPPAPRPQVPAPPVVRPRPDVSTVTPAEQPTFDFPAPEEFAATTLEPTTIMVPGGGGGWTPNVAPAPAPSLTVGPTEVVVEPQTERGFGLVEAALTAAVSWILWQGYKSRRW